MSKLCFALIGAGRVGTAAAYLLRLRGFDLQSVIDSSEASLERAKTYLHDEPEFTTDLSTLPTDVDFILLGVRDDQIAGVVQELWQHKLIRPKQVLVHFSGAHPAQVGHLSEMKEIGRLAMHPLQAVADVETGIIKLPQSVWSIEGDAAGVHLGAILLQALEVRWLKINADQKALYHAAACVVSNYLVTLTQMGREMLSRVGFPPELAQEALLPLIQGTIDNLNEKRPEDALTGPIARADVSTIESHLQAIQGTDKDWLAAYVALGEATLRYARIPKAEAARIAQCLKEDGQ